jgi:membrane protein DedA with SNARE-associated domain
VSHILDALIGVPAPLLLTVIAVLVFGEAAFFLGFVIPGETAVLLGGFAASTGKLSLVTLTVVVVLAAIIGDSVGYEVGRRFGPRLLTTRPLARHGHRVHRAKQFLDGRGAPAVFLGRFTAFLRAVVPGLAGLSRMHYPRFLAYNALGGLVWGAGCALLGYFAGSSYQEVGHWIGRTGAAVLALVVLAALFVWHRQRRRARTDRLTRL